MAEDPTRTLMENYVSALIDRTDFARFFAPDVVWTTMETGQQVRGREAVRDFIVAFHTQVFDARPELVGLTTGEGTATIEARFVGTQTGEFAGVPPTGRQVRVPYCIVYDIADGALTALRAYIPIAAMRDQLQGVPGAVGAAAP